jgi:hypothetical protein
MKDKKKINRNPFNEKLIHRYYFETLYLGDTNIKKKLVPDDLKQKISKLNLIVPEDTLLYSGYRSDFTIYLKEDDVGIPVEIKWTSKEFNKINQINALKNKKGFLVSFDDPINVSIPHVKIDLNDFKRWLIKRIDSLWDDSVSEKIKSKEGEKSWIVILRGSGALDNFHKMIHYCKSNKLSNFWAFKNERYVIRNILDLSINDEMIFIFAKTRGNEGSKMILNSNQPLEISEIYHTNIEVPYYINLKSTFFEKSSDLPINKRIWPHFFDFKIENILRFKNTKLERKNMSVELKNSIARSSNHGGILMPISSVDIKELKGMIRLLSHD